MTCHSVFDIIALKRRCRIFLSQDGQMPQEARFCSVLTTDDITYDAFCDDFGPMNLLSIIRFIQALDQQAGHGVSDSIAYVTDSGPRALTNAVFLLGAYMLIMLDMAPGAVAERFAGLDPALMEPYRDASYSPPDFRLSLLDCWSGIHRAIAHRWLARPSHPGSPL